MLTDRQTDVGHIKVCNINKYTLRQILHGPSNCLGDALVKSDQEVQFFNSLLNFIGRLDTCNDVTGLQFSLCYRGRKSR